MFNYHTNNQSEHRAPTLNTAKVITHSIIGGILGIIMLIAFFGSWVIIDAGESAVVLRVGRIDRIIEPGWNWKIPLAEKVFITEVRTVKQEVEASAASFDLQEVTTNVAIQYNVVPTDIGLLYEEVGPRYRSRVIDPAIQDAIKEATAQFTAEELVQKRAEVSEVMETLLRERLAEIHIRVTNVDVIDFDYSESFKVAIEGKVTAEQKALEAENKLKQVEFEAQQRIEQARGEAEAIRIQAQAITSQGGKDYVNLQWIEAWRNGGASVPTTIIGEGGNNFLYNIK